MALVKTKECNPQAWGGEGKEALGSTGEQRDELPARLVQFLCQRTHLVSRNQTFDPTVQLECQLFAQRCYVTKCH